MEVPLNSVSWNAVPTRKNLRIFWKSAPLYLFLATWKECNRIIIENAKFSTNRVKLVFISSLFFWAGSVKIVDGSFVRCLLYRHYGYA